MQVDRRRFWNAAAFVAAFFPLLCPAGEAFDAIHGSPQQIAWQDLAFGAIVHFGTNTFLDREWGDGTASPNTFAPDAVAPDQWVAAGRSAGINYFVLVAKHHDGFALWPTAQSAYSVAHSPWLGGQGDLVAMTSAACHAAGVGFGIYLSPWDRHEPRYADANAYDKFYAAQLTELASGYGPIVEWWLDGAGSAGHVYDFARYVEQLRTFQPNAMVFADVALFDYGDIRWVGNEEGVISGENWNVIDRHGALRWRPVEVDTPLHKAFWFFHDSAAYRDALKTVDELVQNWEDSVGKGGQLMLGLAPDRHGVLPDADVARLAELGQALNQRYGNAANLAAHAERAHGGASNAVDNDPDTFWSSPDETHGALELTFSKPITFDHAMAMERLEEGQHVRSYEVQAWIDGGWKTLARAAAIGHMKIDRFALVTTRRVRLNILSSVGTARIREFKLFHVGSTVSSPTVAAR